MKERTMELIDRDALLEIIGTHCRDLWEDVWNFFDGKPHRSRDYLRGLENGYWAIKKDIEQLPTIAAVPLEDYRSMEATVNKLTEAIATTSPNEQLKWEGDTAVEQLRQLGYGLGEKVEQMPSAQPETAKRIVGKSRDGMTLWYQCDMCNEPVDAQDNFCRGCGRRLTDE